MSIVSKPDVTFNIVSAAQAVENAPQKVLFIGQLNGGSATAGNLVEDIGTNSEENTLFGQRSMLATMIREFRKINSKSRVDAIPLADPTGGGAAAATATITLTGSSTEAANYKIAIQSETLHTFTVGVSNGQSNTAVLTNLQTAINADDSILCTASVASNVLTLTATHTGTDGNDIKIRLINGVAGITTALVGFTGGVGDVTIPDLPTTLGSTRYQTVVYPSVYTLSTIATYLNNNFNLSNAIRDGVAIVSASNDTTANAISAISTINSQSMVYISDKKKNESDLKGGALLEYNPVISSIFSAVRSLRLTDGADIASYLVGGNVTNTFGGTFRAATPYHETPLSNLPVIVKNYGWSSSEQDALNEGGVSLMGNNSALNRIVCGDIVTTYLTNGAGSPDTTFKYLNYVDTASAIREYFFNNNKEQYAQTVLTTGDIVPGIRMANAESIKSFQYGLFDTLSGRGYGLIQAGSQAFKFFKQNLDVQVNESTGTATLSMITPIVSQLRAMNGTMQIGFDINTNT